MRRFLGISSSVTCVIFILSCTPPPATKVDPNSVMLFPPPPETPRIQFLCKFSGSSDVEKVSRFAKFINAEQSDIKTMSKPYGVAIRNGVIYVCDAFSAGLKLVDLPRHKFEEFRPFGLGSLPKPINVTSDRSGAIYVADTKRQEVVVFGPDLKHLKTLKGPSLRPVDVQVFADSLLIVDMKDKNVEIWSIRQGKKLCDFPPPDPDRHDSLRLVEPISVAIDPSGNIYVCDFGMFCVRKYDRKGKLILTVGRIGRNLGEFARPKGIAVDREERLYVVDAAFENVQIFDKEGRLLMFFGGPYERPGNMYLPAQVSIDYENIELFKPYVLPGATLGYVILVSNQYGPDKINVYGFLSSVDSALVSGSPVAVPPTLEVKAGDPVSGGVLAPVSDSAVIPEPVVGPAPSSDSASVGDSGEEGK